MVHSKLRQQSCWRFAVTSFAAVWKSEGCSISHPGEIRSRPQILARDWSAGIIGPDIIIIIIINEIYIAQVRKSQRN